MPPAELMPEIAATGVATMACGRLWRLASVRLAQSRGGERVPERGLGAAGAGAASAVARRLVALEARGASLQSVRSGEGF